MIKNQIKRFLVAFCFCGFALTQVASNVPVLAVEQGDIDNAKDDIAKKEQEIKDLQNKLDALSKDIANTQAYINELDTMMANLTLDVRNWQTKVDAKQVEIDAKIVEIEQKQVQINNTQIELDNAKLKEVQYYNEMSYRIQYMYECGDDSFLEMIFTAEDLADLLGRSEYISNITQYDRQQLEELVGVKNSVDVLLTRYENELTELDAAKTILEEEKKVLDAHMVELKYSQASLDTVMASKQNTLNKLENQQNITEVQKEAAKQELEDQKAILAELKKLWEEEQNKIPMGSSADKETQKTLDAIYASGGFAWPLPGYTTITSKYGWRTHPKTGQWALHDGTDFAGAGVNGKPIVAAYSGTVIAAQHYAGYGNTVRISHGTGVVTLYAHCSSLAVKTGDVVKKGQVVAYVGMSGSATGPHLHFSIFLKGESVDPMNYVRIPTY